MGPKMFVLVQGGSHHSTNTVGGTSIGRRRRNCSALERAGPRHPAAGPARRPAAPRSRHASLRRRPTDLKIALFLAGQARLLNSSGACPSHDFRRCMAVPDPALAGAWVGIAGPAWPAARPPPRWALARERPAEIISVDSALVYRGMDIGTAKPSAAELTAVPHHLIDIRDPSESYNAAAFVADATRLIAEVRARGRLPLLVGGTMLYFAVTHRRHRRDAGRRACHAGASRCRRRGAGLARDARETCRSRRCHRRPVVAERQPAHPACARGMACERAAAVELSRGKGRRPARRRRSADWHRAFPRTCGPCLATRTHRPSLRYDAGTTASSTRCARRAPAAICVSTCRRCATSDIARREFLDEHPHPHGTSTSGGRLRAGSTTPAANAASQPHGNSPSGRSPGCAAHAGAPRHSSRRPGCRGTTGGCRHGHRMTAASRHRRQSSRPLGRPLHTTPSAAARLLRQRWPRARMRTPADPPHRRLLGKARQRGDRVRACVAHGSHPVNSSPSSARILA